MLRRPSRFSSTYLPWTYALAACVGLFAGRSSPASAADEPSQAVLEVRFVDAPRKTVERLLADAAANQAAPGTLTNEQVRGFLNPAAKEEKITILAAPRMVVLLGQPGALQIGSETRDPQNGESQFEGVSVEATAELQGERLLVKLEAARRDRMPGGDRQLWRELKVDTRVSLGPDQTACVGGLGADGREVVLLVSAKKAP